MRHFWQRFVSGQAKLHKCDIWQYQPASNSCHIIKMHQTYYILICSCTSAFYRELIAITLSKVNESQRKINESINFLLVILSVLTSAFKGAMKSIPLQIGKFLKNLYTCMT